MFFLSIISYFNSTSKLQLTLKYDTFIGLVVSDFVLHKSYPYIDPALKKLAHLTVLQKTNNQIKFPREVKTPQVSRLKRSQEKENSAQLFCNLQTLPSFTQRCPEQCSAFLSAVPDSAQPYSALSRTVLSHIFVICLCF